MVRAHRIEKQQRLGNSSRSLITPRTVCNELNVARALCFLVTVLAGVHPHHGTSGELAEVPEHARPHVGACPDHHPPAQHRREQERRPPRSTVAIEYCFLVLLVHNSIAQLRHFMVRSIVWIVWYGNR